MTDLVVDAYSEGWLRKGFPWVYPKEVQRGRARPGDRVRLRSAKGDVLGTGLADDGFLAARVLRHGDETADRAWVHALLDRAAALRDVVIDGGTDGYRLVNAECDGLPGVRIDWWRTFAVVCLDSASLRPIVDDLVAWLEEHRQPRGIVLCYRPDHRDPDRGALPGPSLVAGHPPPGAVRVRERELRFDVWPLEGPDVGLYPDMREVRAWLEPTWGGTSVLNTFAYTGAFSVSAARNGAAEVVSVDLSGRYLSRAEDNFRANELDPEQHEFLEEDVFKALDRFRRTGRSFDRVVLDPPSFSHGAGVFSAKNDSARLVAAAARVTAPGGWIIACSNLGEVSPKVFDGWIGDGLRKAGRQAQVLASLGQAADHPAATWFPEGRYLKVRVLRLD
ncbi:MAG: class I SAM-dependent rRNA methyltransferase [Alphaproteobacteria bacterium]|nr:class I SAM-dependent rRNA methyltransferase [Alphaproteobacteria bacterium]